MKERKNIWYYNEKTITTRPVNSRYNKMDPQRKDTIRKAKTKMGRQS